MELTTRLARYAPGSFMGEHAHNAPSLCLVLSGAYEETISGRSTWAQPGSLLFHPKGTPHAQAFGAAGSLKLLFGLDADATAYLACRSSIDVARQVRSAEIAHLGRRLAAELKSPDLFSDLIVNSLSMELLALFGRGAASPGQATPASLMSACEFLDANMDGPTTIARVARAVDRVPAELAQDFRASFGESIGERWRRLRVEKAARLLSETRQPISEIAADCGFYDQSHLTRAFKRLLGCTPARYRRQV